MSDLTQANAMPSPKKSRPPLVIECETILPATPDEVWSVLTDFQTWSEWQKAYRIEGEAQVGCEIGQAVWTETRAGKKTPIELKGAVTIVDRPYRLVWNLGVPKILFVTVTFELEEFSRATRLKHSLKCDGLVPRIASDKARRLATPFVQAFCISVERRMRKAPKLGDRR